MFYTSEPTEVGQLCEDPRNNHWDTESDGDAHIEQTRRAVQCRIFVRNPS